MTKLIVAFITFVAPHLSQGRALELAKPIAAVSRDVDDAITLVVVANSESSFRKDIETCEVTGDNGRAIGLTQLHWYHWGRYTKDEICGNTKLQMAIALRALGEKSVGDSERMARYLGRKPGDEEVLRRVTLIAQLRGIANANGSR